MPAPASSAPAKPVAAVATGNQTDLGDDIIALAARKFNIPFAATEAKPAEDASEIAPDDVATDDAAPEASAETDEETDAGLEDEALNADNAPADDAEPAASEPTEDEKKAAAQKARDDADLKKLAEPVRKTVQAILDKRIGRITAKAAAEKTELSARLADLEAQLAEAKTAAEGKPAQATVVGTVHPLLLDPSEAAITTYVENVEKFEDWAAEHEDGWEPSEAEQANGYKPLGKLQIRQQLRAMQRERDKVVTEARAAITARASAETEARKLLPALFDAKSPDYQAARSLLREQPELKRFPDHQLRIAEILLGRKALAALRTAAVKPAKPATPPARASRAPGGGTAPKGGFAEPRSGGAAPVAAVQTAITKPTQQNMRAAALAVLE